MKIEELPPNSLVLELDADSISYAITHQLKDEVDFSIADFTIDDYVIQLFGQVSCTHYTAFLGGVGNFRYGIAKTKPYKGNRPVLGEREKAWKQYVNEYLVQKYGFQRVDNIEADDAIAITTLLLRESGINHLICSNDKDVDQVWGNHYSMNKRKFYHIGEDEAKLLLYKQYITGDSVDNIPGLSGKGKVYADRLLDDKEPKDYLKSVEWAYACYYKPVVYVSSLDYFEEQRQLLTMLESYEGFEPQFNVMNLAQMKKDEQVFDI